MEKRKAITNELCCGCKACEQKCPKYAIIMKSDREGFWYPYVDMSKCIGCEICVNVCPENYQSFSEKSQKCVCYYNLDYGKQMQYSSGGAFIKICETYLEKCKSYAIYGATLTNKNVVKHVKIENLDEIDCLSRSKYVQSDTEGIYRKVKYDLDNNVKVIFSGTPCQVQALKNYLGRNYNNLLLIDFVCHGVPSPLAYKKYCESIEKKYSKKIAKVLFRYKSRVGKNRRWDTQGIYISFDDGTNYSGSSYQDIYMRAFLNELLSRPSCGECKFVGLNRISDLTLGDFWGIEEKYFNKSIQNTAGTSMILVNTTRGNQVIKNIEKELSNDEVFEYVDINIGVDKNIPLRKSIPPNSLRKNFYRNLRKTRWSFEECYDQTFYPRGNIFKRILRKINRIFL